MENLSEMNLFGTPIMVHIGEKKVWREIDKNGICRLRYESQSLSKFK